MCIIPGFSIKLTNISVQSLGQDRTGGDGSIGSVRFLVFPMALVEDAGPDGVELIKVSQINIFDESRQKIMKMGKASKPSIYEMVCCNTLVIINTSFQ